MRQILSISMPVNMIKDIKQEAKAGGFATLSEFIRHLIRLWKEERLAKDLKQDMIDIRNGKGIEIKESLDELLD